MNAELKSKKFFAKVTERRAGTDVILNVFYHFLPCIAPWALRRLFVIHLGYGDRLDQMDVDLETFPIGITLHVWPT